MKYDGPPMVNLEHLATYVPRRILRGFADSSGGQFAPHVDRFPAAILFADISGFTDLSERLGSKGPAGTEELSAIINACFGSMLGPVSRSGGDVLMMAGDALVVAWDALPDGSLREPLLKAMQCAREIQQSSTKTEGVTLSVRIGIGAGLVEAFFVGGIEGALGDDAVGDPFRQMGLAQGQARPGDVVGVAGKRGRSFAAAAQGAIVGEGCVRIDSAEAPRRLPGEEPRDLTGVPREMWKHFCPSRSAFSCTTRANIGWRTPVR
ncbi:MAG: adenylate/guanylate cyclase domain-containing protein [Chthoniobacter sp.]